MATAWAKSSEVVRKRCVWVGYIRQNLAVRPERVVERAVRMVPRQGEVAAGMAGEHDVAVGLNRQGARPGVHAVEIRERVAHRVEGGVQRAVGVEPGQEESVTKMVPRRPGSYHRLGSTWHP